jgi:hypothetical protein
MIAMTIQTDVPADTGCISASFSRIEIPTNCIAGTRRRIGGPRRGRSGLRRRKDSSTRDVICKKFITDFGPVGKLIRLLELPKEGYFVHQNPIPRISKAIP